MDALARRAGALTSLTGRLAGATLAAGAWLWGLAAYPFTFDAPGSEALAAVGLVLLLAPGLLLLLFYVGLRQVAALPGRLARTLDTGRTRTAALYATASAPRAHRWWLARLLRGVLDLRALVAESRDVLLQYAALIRLLNPWTLLAVAAAVVLGAGLIAAALLSLPLLLLF
ncbi:MAG: hypothetical protein KatS3mg042_1158 [Rhodothermaceae bacterium]|nr:MAG: hypothetical protein KatS3mg042_1158 [Rhodothermaceae bacterium]